MPDDIANPYVVRTAAVWISTTVVRIRTADMRSQKLQADRKKNGYVEIMFSTLRQILRRRKFV